MNEDIENKKCKRCSRPRMPGRTRCEVCINKGAQYAINRYRKSIKQGRCPKCGAPATEGIHCPECAGRYRSNARRWAMKEKDKYRLPTLEHYGNKCACCGETEFLFLTIDHVNNDGAEHRKTVSAAGIWKWLVENDFPDGFQILCFNCNCGRHRNGGVCPHKMKGD